jgi:plasmid rolling circle replication initiator protein Rep
MSQTKRFRGSILGLSRILEYPPQKDDPDFVHPHFHCLFVVPASYFDTSLNLYIKQDEWQQLWKKSMRLDYDPSVDVRIIKAKGENDPIAKAVAEFAKYPLKSIDLDPLSVEQFQELTIQMHKKRAVAFGGIIKEYRKKLVLDDCEDGDLIYDDPEASSEWVKICEYIYEFGNGAYGLDYYLKNT